MPYLVTTKTPAVLSLHAVSERVLSRRAVATLDEAREHVAQAAHEQGAFGIQLAAGDLPEQGGTITLPDNTVIEVKRASWDDLVGPNGWNTYTTEAEVVAAYNAAQAVPQEPISHGG